MNFLADFLGTVWFIALVAVAGLAAGAIFGPMAFRWIKGQKK